MTNPATTPASITLPALVQKYLVAALSIAVILGGGYPTLLQSVHAANGNLLVETAAYLTFGVLAAGAVASIAAKLLNARWQGGLKTGIAIFTTVASIVIPFLLKGHFSLETDLPLVVVGAANALLTEFGVYVRTSDPINVEGPAPAVASVVMSLPTPSPAFDAGTSSSLPPAPAGNSNA